MADNAFDDDLDNDWGQFNDGGHVYSYTNAAAD